MAVSSFLQHQAPPHPMSKRLVLSALAQFAAKTAGRNMTQAAYVAVTVGVGAMVLLTIGLTGILLLIAHVLFGGVAAGLVGAAALSMVWVPTYQSLTWMWIGFGAGAGVSLPVFLFYAGGDHDARRGLIFMGTAATLGLVAGAVFTVDSKEFGQSSGPGHIGDRHSPVELTGGGLMPVPGGIGFQLSGLLF